MYNKLYDIFYQNFKISVLYNEDFINFICPSQSTCSNLLLYQEIGEDSRLSMFLFQINTVLSQILHRATQSVSHTWANWLVQVDYTL